LRQQRCRARKRQTMLQERREHSEARQSHITQDSRPHAIPDPSHGRPAVFPTRRTKGVEYWGDASTPSEPIYNCVSFDSQRSFEEAQKSHERSQHSAGSHTGDQTPPGTPPAFSPERKPVEIIGVPEDSDESLVPEEEAAIAAMLSLKTGPKTHTTSYNREQPSRPGESRVPRVTKFRYYRSWQPRHYETFEYGRPPRVPEYYKMPIPPPPPPHYSYYPAYQRYSRYDYD
jgi:hypothetical protein